MGRRSNYDKYPTIPAGPEGACHVGWSAIIERLQGLRSRPRCILVVECYPGVRVDEVRRAFTEGSVRSSWWTPGRPTGTGRTSSASVPPTSGTTRSSAA